MRVCRRGAREKKLYLFTSIHVKKKCRVTRDNRHSHSMQLINAHNY